VFVTTRLRLFRFFLFFFDFDHFTAFVETAIRADRVGQAHGAAIRTGSQVACLQRIVRAAVIPAALRVFALWMWGHSTYSFIQTWDGVSLRLDMVFAGSGQIIASGCGSVKDGFDV